MNAKLPNHVAFIVDGNRRWAKEQNMLFYDAYLMAGKTLVDNVCFAADQGVKVITAFLFSTENWKRDKQEIESVFKAFSEILYENTCTFVKHGVQVKAIGNLKQLPSYVNDAIANSIDNTQTCTRSQFILAFNYGGRWDIVNAAKQALRVQQNGSIESMNETLFANFLSTASFGDPDLLIRTGNQQRISNFLMWQLAYSELYFSKLMWPDFTPKQFQYALNDFAQRERRKGA